MADRERALRHMVVKLRDLPEADFDAVIDTLTPTQRARVVDLLQELEGDSIESRLGAEVRAPHQPVAIPPAVSPWLAARINGNPAAGDEVLDVFEMTAHATRALRECAAKLAPIPRPRRSPSLFSVALNRLSAKGAQR